MVAKARPIRPPVDLEEHNRRPEPDPVDAPPPKKYVSWEALSPRVQESLLLRARGMTLADAAQVMGVTERTVKAYASAAYAKTGTDNLIGCLVALGVLQINPDIVGGDR